MKYIFISFFLLASLPAFSSGLDIPLFATSAIPGVAAVPDASIPNPDDPEAKKTVVAQPAEKTTPNIGIQAERLPALTVAPGISIPFSQKSNYAVPFRPQESQEPMAIRLQPIPTEKPLLPEETIAPIRPKTLPAQVDSAVLDINIYNFDIDEFTLGETPASVQELAQIHNLSTDRIDYDVQPFMENVLTMRCKKQGFYTQADVKKCIRKEAEQLDAYYISGIVLKRPERKETYTINFTSLLTGNQAYRIKYTEQGDHSLSYSVKDKAAKAARKKAFWDKVYENYGTPTDVANKIWGDPARLYLQAAIPETRLDATLVLEDKSLPQQDADAAKTFFLSYIENDEE